MKALVVYCHPRPDSFTAAVRDVVMAKLDQHGAQTRLIDLYGQGFDPVMTAQELDHYEDQSRNQRGLEDAVADLAWCDTLIFIYPTWWYGMPAMLKGWLDRAFLPGVAFLMPDDAHAAIRPGLSHIKRLGVFTTCGASWWLTRFIGAPGRRTLLRGVRLLCAKSCKTVFAAHYNMDSSTPQSRAAHLGKVTVKCDRFFGASSDPQKVMQ